MKTVFRCILFGIFTISCSVPKNASNRNNMGVLYMHKRSNHEYYLTSFSSATIPVIKKQFQKDDTLIIRYKSSFRIKKWNGFNLNENTKFLKVYNKKRYKQYQLYEITTFKELCDRGKYNSEQIRRMREIGYRPDDLMLNLVYE